MISFLFVFPSSVQRPVIYFKWSSVVTDYAKPDILRFKKIDLHMLPTICKAMAVTAPSVCLYKV